MSFYASVVGIAPNGNPVELHDPEPESGLRTFAEAVNLSRDLIGKVMSRPEFTQQKPNSPLHREWEKESGITGIHVHVESIRGNVLSDDPVEAQTYGMEPSPGSVPRGRGAVYGLFL